MSIPFRPILSALLRNRTGAVLVSLQIAIALAVLVNAVYIVQQRIELMSRPTAIDDANIFVVSSTGFTRDFDALASMREDLAYLHGVPGVIAATPVNAIPLSGGGSATGVNNVTGQPAKAKNGNYFQIDEHGLDSLGLRLLAGRAFTTSDILPPASSIQSSYSPQIMITQALAKALFPSGDALGKTVYDTDDKPMTIIGITDDMLGSWLNSDHPNWVFFSAQLPAGKDVRYLVRAQPGRRDALMRTVEEHLSKSNPNRAINWVRTLELFKGRSYLADRNMGIFLASVTALLLAITSLGIFGLATFNVSTRTKQIGTRRAVGARRGDIVRHFLVENWLITSAGVVVGCLMALGVGYWLSYEYQFERIDLYYLVAGALVLWTIGLMAAWQPARRAARVSPALAARTV
jgi:putative ABC transport system permease protein